MSPSDPRPGTTTVPPSTSHPETYALVRIGVVRSSLIRVGEAPKQGSEGAPEAFIELEPAVLPALDGVCVGADLIVLTWLHAARRDVLRVHPRDDLDQPLTGVFATRSQDRPNPIGVHRVKVLDVDAGGLRVWPMEAIDGTPVIDLKIALERSGDH